MVSLVDLYKDYYREQTPKSIDSLFSGMLDYDYLNYANDMRRIVAMHSQTRCRGEKKRLYTNGSTRCRPRGYEFGPNFWLWVSKLEPFLRNLGDGKTIFLCSRIGGGEPPRRIRISPCEHSTKKHFETNGNLLDNSQIDELFSFVAKINEEGHKANFSSFPDIWNMLFSNPKFERLCLDPKHRIGCLVNNDFEMLLKSDKIYIRDQMINWVSGLNFFDCAHGTRHFLPTFFLGGSCLNLLNLNKTYDDSDRVGVDPGGISVCGCGRPFVPIELNLHAKNRVVDSSGIPVDMGQIRRLVRGRYATLQVHQEMSDKITIMHNPMNEECEKDMARIRAFFQDMETAVEIDRYFELGSKRYCFWRSESADSKQFKLY